MKGSRQEHVSAEAPGASSQASPATRGSDKGAKGGASSVPADEDASVQTFTYDEHRYLFDVMVPGVVGALAVPVGVGMAVAGFLAPIGIIAAVVGAYTVFNTFIAKCYPRRVSVSATELVLESFGRRDAYPLAQIKRLSVRENGRVRAAYIRVNGGGVLRGRYFVGCGDMYTPEGEKGEALYQFFLNTEARLDPDNIRVRARRAETRRVEAASSSERSEDEERAIRSERRRRRRRKH